MVESLAALRPVLPQQTPFGMEIPSFKKPEITSNLSAKEVARMAAGTVLVLVGCAMILDGSINHSNMEAFGGAVFVIGGLYILTR